MRPAELHAAVAPLSPTLRKLVLQVHRRGGPDTLLEMGLAVAGDDEAACTSFICTVLTEVAKLSRDAYLLARVAGDLDGVWGVGRPPPEHAHVFITDDGVDVVPHGNLETPLARALTHSAAVVVEVVR